MVHSPTALFDFGVSQVASNHYLLRGGAAPLVLVMNRKTFDGLPEAAKALIRKYSGERAAATWIESFGATEKQLLDKLKSDPERKVVEPSPSDLQFTSVRRCQQRLLGTGWFPGAAGTFDRQAISMATLGWFL